MKKIGRLDKLFIRDAFAQGGQLEGIDGGKGSGNFGHKGRPGEVGGSGAGGGNGGSGGSSANKGGAEVKQSSKPSKEQLNSATKKMSPKQKKWLQGILAEVESYEPSGGENSIDYGDFYGKMHEMTASGVLSPSEAATVENYVMGRGGSESKYEPSAKAGRESSAEAAKQMYKYIDNKKLSKMFPQLNGRDIAWLQNARENVMESMYNDDDYDYSSAGEVINGMVRNGKLSPEEAVKADAYMYGGQLANSVGYYQGIRNEGAIEYARQNGEYSLSKKGLATGNPGNAWSAKGSQMDILPKGSGTFKVSEGDISSGDSSIAKYIQADGSISPERLEIHDEAIRDMFSDKSMMIPKEGEQPTFYFLGGGSASGKSMFTSAKKNCYEQFGVPSNEDCPTLDADEFKKVLPEYATQIDSDDGAAGFAHEESSSLVKRAMEAAFTNGYNCTLDGTGDGGMGEAGARSVLKKINQARQAGYKIEGRYVTVSMEDALENANKRAIETGRRINEDVIVSIHKSVSSVFPLVASQFDHIELYDNTAFKPTKIAECRRGEQITIHDQAKYDAFLKKANY